MPAKGTTKIPATKRAEIIATKRVTNASAKVIAKQFDVSPNTVHQAEKDATPEVWEMVGTFAERIIASARLNVEDGLKAMNPRLKNPNEPLSSVITGVKTSYDIYRLETNQPTFIEGKTPEHYLMEFIRSLTSKGLERDQIVKVVMGSSVLRDQFQVTDEMKEAAVRKLLTS